MKRALLLIAVCLLLAVSSIASDGNSLSGVYVEARTAEVFTGGCLMSSEAETTGRQAVLAWRVDRGSLNGVSLDGLVIIAAIAGDKNLGIHELGGAKPLSPKIALNVGKHAEHNAGCGAEQWFHPLADVTDATIGMTNENSFSGSELGSKWSDPDKVSAFFGKFTY